MRQWQVVVLVGALLPAATQASQDSRQLQALGLVEFHAGRYPKALEQFTKAVEADPSDVYARYYRGATRSRLGDVKGAIDDFRAVLAAQPDLDAASLDLGVALVQTGKYRAAVPLLVRAQQNIEFDAQASLFLGIAQLRLNDIDTARENFARAAARDPALKTSATYYEGVADYREGDFESAQTQFATVATSNANSDMGREAVAFLAKIQQRLRPVFHAYGSVGLQYDSNVVLAPNGAVIQSPLAISRQSDGAATIDLNGTYSLWRGEETELTLGYEFYQSLYFHLSDFDLTDNGPSIQLVGTAGLLDYGILGRYDNYLLDGNNFLQEATAFPWVGVPESNLGRTEVFFRMRRRDFLDPTYEVRDGFNYATGVRQFVYVNTPDNYVSVGYQFDSEQPLAAHTQENPNQFSYNGHQISTGFGWVFPANISTYTGFLYHRERYGKRPSDGRRDEDYQLNFLVSRPITEYLTVTGAFFGDFNSSINPLYNYTRQIGAIALEVRF